MMNADALRLDAPAEEAYADNLPLYKQSAESSLTPEQENIAVQTISPLLQEKRQMDDIVPGLYLECFILHHTDKETLKYLFLPLLKSVNLALDLTEHDAEKKSMSVLCCLRRELCHQMGLSPVLSNHSVMLNPPMQRAPAFTFRENGLDTGASSIIFRFMSGSSRAALAQINRSNRSTIAPLLLNKVQDSIRQNHLYYGVLSAPIIGWNASLSTLVKKTRDALKTERILLFRTYFESVLFSAAATTSVYQLNPHSIDGHFYPIVCLAALGDEKPEFQRLNLKDNPIPVECTFANPRDYAALATQLTHGVSGYSDPPVHCSRHALLKTRYDGHPTQAVVQVLPKRSTFLRFNRDAAHKKFMESMPHRPLTPHDLMRWLEEFYCDQYLVHKKNSAAKRLALKAAIADIRKAEQSGLDLGSSLTKFLEMSPLEESTLSDFIQDKRLNVRNNQTWGWKIINEWFLQPQNSEVEELKLAV